ncbi:MAG: proteasome subunit beta [Candidatus Lokiarchaeota archaeon]|nr:proteasome subunit beta [Candidatus Lokiarchaeota archaeon]
MQTPLRSKTSDENLIKTGTTTVGVIYRDGVIIGTESQATAGFFVASKQAQKLFKINDYTAATISGGVADCQYVVNQARALANLRKIETGTVASVKYVANSVRNLLYQGRSFFLALMIVGGYSETKDKGVLYGVDLLGTLFKEEKFLSFGSGSPYALGLLESEWKPNLTENQANKLVKKAINAARERDAGSGYEIQLVKITKEGFDPIEGYHEGN